MNEDWAERCLNGLLVVAVFAVMNLSALASSCTVTFVAGDDDCLWVDGGDWR